MHSTSLLKGIHVIEIGHTVAAPYAGMILAQLGATVIKVENPPVGDYTRGMPPYREDSVSAVYQALNRGKKSILLNLKDPSDSKMLHDLIVSQADVLIHNLKFGAIEEIGFGPSQVHQNKPNLIYCNVGAYGHKGPMKSLPGYDPLMQAYSGLMSIMGEEGRAPIRVGVSITDQAAGMWAVIGILSALKQRDQTGQGCVIDTSLYETALAWMSVQFSSYDASKVVPKKEGSGLAMMAPYQAFSTKDDYLMVAAGNDNIFNKLCLALGEPAQLMQEIFKKNASRVKNRSLLLEIIEPIFKTKTTANWIQILTEHEVPCSAINPIDQVIDNEQTKALEIFQKSPDGNGLVCGLPLSINGIRPPFETSAPTLGQHNFEILGL
jgi:crotonobetainyl-CoA:carnitine CoA-transferase CaiB-like acyl-CoA transferase